VFLPYVGLPAAAVILAFQRWPTGESRRAQGGVFAPKPARGPKSSSDEGS
jgi:hypothetical protein